MIIIDVISNDIPPSGSGCVRGGQLLTNVDKIKYYDKCIYVCDILLGA